MGPDDMIVQDDSHQNSPIYKLPVRLCDLVYFFSFHSSGQKHDSIK